MTNHPERGVVTVMTLCDPFKFLEQPKIVFGTAKAVVRDTLTISSVSLTMTNYPQIGVAMVTRPIFLFLNFWESIISLERLR